MNDIQWVLLLIRIMRKSNPITDSKNSFFYPLNFVCFHFIGNESTLFVVVIANRLESGCYSQDFFKRAKIVNDCLKEKLPLIPQTKVVIISDPSRLMNPGKIPPETLQVYLPRRVGLGAVLELLNKRYKSLDLIAVILELKRSYLTAYGKGPYYHHYGGWFSPVDVTIDVSENLSCLPRLQKTEQL